MPIDPRIALGVQQLQLQDPLAQYGKVAAIQSAQNQNALAQYQLTAAQREQETTNALNKAYASAYNPQTGEIDANKLRSSLATGGFGSKLPAVEKSLLELGTAKTAQQKAQSDLIDAKLKQSRAFLENVNPADPNAPTQFMAWSQANLNDPVLAPVFKQYGVTPEQVTAQVQQAVQAGPAAFAELVQRSKLGTEKFMELNKPQLSTKDIGGTVIDRTFQPLTGQITEVVRTAKTMAPGEAERIANEQKRITQDARRLSLEDRRLAVLEENQRRDADPVFQQQMAAARVTGEAIAKDDVRALQALPKVIDDAKLAVSILDQMVGKRDSKTGKLLTEDPVTGEPIKNNKPHPGFAPAVGMGGFGTLGIPGIAQITPGTDAANFRTLYDQITGVAFSEAFETLKGGGAITEKEGAKATAARNRMSLAQSETEFIKAALEYRDVVAKGVERAQARAARATTRMAPAAPAAAIPESLKNRPDFKELERLWPYMNESDRKTFMGE